MTQRNRYHAKTEATLTYWLKAWLAKQPFPAGDLYSGEVGCILRQEYFRINCFTWHFRFFLGS